MSFFSDKPFFWETVFFYAFYLVMAAVLSFLIWSLWEMIERKTDIEISYECMCIDCGWKGSESELHFLDGWEVCPKCHQPDFIISGEEIDEMNEVEDSPL